VGKYSEGVFWIRFMGYGAGAANQVHQDALLIYNKRGVKRRDALEHLSILSDFAKYSSPERDQNNSAMLPMLNRHNYAPYEGSTYRDNNLISLMELKGCRGIKCKREKPSKWEIN